MGLLFIEAIAALLTRAIDGVCGKEGTAMKVKIFTSSCACDLEKEINEYLKDVSPVDFVDIKYSSSDMYSEAMVITRC